MELTEQTRPLESKVKPIPFDQFQKNGDWMVPRGRTYYTPLGNFLKGKGQQVNTGSPSAEGKLDRFSGNVDFFGLQLRATKDLHPLYFQVLVFIIIIIIGNNFW